MKNVVVDTNILFSSLLAKNSKIREILERKDLRFYAPNFLMVEIFKHKDRILRSSKAELYPIFRTDVSLPSSSRNESKQKTDPKSSNSRRFSNSR